MRSGSPGRRAGWGRLVGAVPGFAASCRADARGCRAAPGRCRTLPGAAEAWSCRSEGMPGFAGLRRGHAGFCRIGCEPACPANRGREWPRPGGRLWRWVSRRRASSTRGRRCRARRFSPAHTQACSSRVNACTRRCVRRVARQRRFEAVGQRFNGGASGPRGAPVGGEGGSVGSCESTVLARGFGGPR